jgi:hypothetical protein
MRAPLTEVCPAHPEDPAAWVCASCDRAMCDECARKTVDGAAWCSPCVALLLRPVSPLVPLGLGALIALLLALLAARLPIDPPLRWAAGGGGVLLVALTAWRMWTKAERRRRAHVIDTRPEAAPGPPRVLEHHPFRGTLRRLRRRVAPPVSGVTAVCVIGAALLVAAAVVPGLLSLPRWIELEAVIAVWWLVLAATLATLLHRGQRVARDAATAQPAGGGGFGSGGGWESLNLADGCVDLDAIWVVIGVLLAFLLGLLVVELLLLPLLFGAYLLLLAALRRAANDRHACEGHAPRAVLWGALWATLYTAPLAALVWAVHRL